MPHVCLPYITKEGAGGPPQPGFFGGLLGRGLRSAVRAQGSQRGRLRRARADAAGRCLGRAAVGRGRRCSRRSTSASSAARAARPTTAWTASAAGRFDLLTSERHADGASTSATKPTPVRDRYGRNIYGQSVLLARRLIEAGTRMVTISWAPDANATWDTHGWNFKKLKNTLLPQFDAACGSLVDDLAERGMLDRTLVAVLGDFGRTPKINASDGGRDHWNYCYSLMLVGGGVQRRLRLRRQRQDRRVPGPRCRWCPATSSPRSITCWAFRTTHELHDQLDRPHRLVPAGNVVPSLLA